jgi:hypothetical protein
MIKHKLKAHEKDWNTSFLGKVLFVRRISILIIWWMMEERVAMRSLLTFEKVWFNWRISWILVTFDSDLISHNNSNNSYNINKDSCFKNEKGSLVDSVISKYEKEIFFSIINENSSVRNKFICFLSSGITCGFVA